MVPRARIELALPKKPDYESDAVTLGRPILHDTRASSILSGKLVPDIFTRTCPIFVLIHSTSYIPIVVHIVYQFRHTRIFMSHLPETVVFESDNA